MQQVDVVESRITHGTSTVLSRLAMSIWLQSRVTAQGRTVLAVVFVAVLAGIGAALASCSDEQAATASKPSVDTPSADPATSTHPEPELTTSTESPPPLEPDPEPTPTTQPEPTPAEPEPTPPEPEPEPTPTTEPPATTLPDEPEPDPATGQPSTTPPSTDDEAETSQAIAPQSTELEQPVDGNDQTGSDDSAVSEETLGSAERVSRISHVRRLPWGEGFLQVGHPVVDEDRVDRTRLLSRVSADGLDWSPFERLPIGLPDPQFPGDRGGWPYRRGGSVVVAASDGEHLVLATLGEDTVVAITSDLTRWETFEIPAPSSEGLPDGVTAEPSMIDLAIGPEGWLLLREVQLGVDPWVIAPADIRETARTIYPRDPDYVGGELVQGESQGVEIDWETELHEPSDPYFTRFATWEELGIDEDTYREYGWVHYANKPYTPSHLASGEVWVAEWGNEPVRNALPAVSGGFWNEVVGTDAGYLARSYWGEGGYPQAVGPDYFSADGSNWVRRDTPILKGLPFFADISVVTDGIVLNGHLFYPPSYPDAATESESQLWLGDATGTNWRPVELPGLSEGSQFDLRYSRGGAVVKGGEPEDDPVGEWMDDSSVEWMMASRDGVNWLVVEDRAVGDLREFVVNGNVMLAFDRQGNTHRFLLP